MKLLKTNRPRYSVALISSLFLHVLFLGYWLHSPRPSMNHEAHSIPSQRSLQTVQLDSVKIISKQQRQAIKEALRRQIVANELNGRKERPLQSRFSGEADRTFDRQTIAARNGSFKAAGLGHKNGSDVAPSQQMTAPAEPVKKTASAKKPKALSLSDLGSIQLSKIEEQENAKEQAIHDQLGKAAAQFKNAPALGSERGTASSAGLAQNNDFVEDVPLGDMTNLNTTEFKYYGFYHRIRQKLEQYWGSSIQAKARNLYKSGRRIPASENLITAVQVVLDDRGRIVEIKIEGTSGIRELDQAAIESFNKAGPFPNPPKGLLVDGRAVIQWGFVVKS